MIDCKENEDGTFTISWDENDPRESVLNDWTKEDFIEVIRNYAEEEIASQNFFSKNAKKSGEKSQESYYDSESEGKDYDAWSFD